MQERSDSKVFSRKSMTPDDLIKMLAFSHSSKTALAATLKIEMRMPFLRECAKIERSYTERCASMGKPCLQDGCPMDDETCLEALLNAEPDYSQRVYRAWLNIFKDPNNRTDEWK